MMQTITFGLTRLRYREKTPAHCRYDSRRERGNAFDRLFDSGGMAAGRYQVESDINWLRREFDHVIDARTGRGVTAFLWEIVSRRSFGWGGRRLVGRALDWIAFRLNRDRRSVLSECGSERRAA